MSLKEKVDLDNLPKHIAVIMDGNGRWAKQKGGLRIFGHQSAITAVRETVEAAAELGVEYLTLYAFSTENWSRPAFEVSALMQLLVSTIRKETSTLNKNNIRLLTIGDTASLPASCQLELQEAMEITKDNTRMTLVLALSYSGRWDITQAVQKLSQEVKDGAVKPQDVNENLFKDYLSTAGMPDPELLIRTSGEQRISNFLLWQLAYTELYITKLLWPDFRKEHLYEAIIAFQSRERRFGKTSEQLTK
ncbi:isoprenyl transferase [Pontibacter sp. SGAir0037]|uniref:isoprenyl transferase n=1 Tax=Pontibacter sp. SGAir0037 TaxID=2571030 RepID=UPI0010CD40BD|nr:isoprenyl transferase [Pontibacter sp. SGAir0037]QCR24296.1 isoprenyl transferase [Pontibacter sp. SGAir0037]